MHKDPSVRAALVLGDNGIQIPTRAAVGILLQDPSRSLAKSEHRYPTIHRGYER